MPADPPTSSAPPAVDPDGLWLDDLREGMRIVSDEYPVTVEEIIAFAGRYDPQVFHLDAERARHSVFAGLAASGWMTAAITMRLMITSGLALATGMIGLENTVAWPTATRPGDRLHVELTVESIRPSSSVPDRATVTLVYDTLNQDGEVRQHSIGRILAWQKPTAPAAG